MNFAGQTWVFENCRDFPSTLVGNYEMGTSGNTALFTTKENSTAYCKIQITSDSIKYFTTASSSITACNLTLGSDIFRNSYSRTGRLISETGSFVTNTNAMYIVHNTSSTYALTPGKTYKLSGTALTNGSFNVRANFFNDYAYNGAESINAQYYFIGRTGDNATNELVFTVPAGTKQTIFTCYKEATDSGNTNTLKEYVCDWAEKGYQTLTFTADPNTFSPSEAAVISWIKRNGQRDQDGSDMYLVSDNDITAVANAIRSKIEEHGGYFSMLVFPDDFVDAINSL